ncbi:myeloid-associated differentiation marker [Tachyglossus aculeatus]|uniref:myeloid-associated differentiation marker n=1 Tax=Tachyglossus aculeatus TaxID=9261 RepID=UPI0018F47DD2|nr:myeloid-associated differentiation marker [Tachyglossus aculeatus]XP_038609000.1 myeloid-associated differentiation marker [Tachyglossus aculeatus]XP_038609001.1 myeloid-associated differentiation marker [Tachyglossus aculeatus]XP_038609002.1 myeloid-associated differentiation marker [Tachyglossus aculeatus]
MPITVTRTTITTTSMSPGGGNHTIVGSPRALTTPLGIVRLLQLLFTCVAFSLVAHIGGWFGSMGDWCMFSWCFCFAMTLVILLVEVGGLQPRVPVSWRNFPITFACYAALFCLSASIIYPVAFVQYLHKGEQKDCGIAATVFSILAFLAYTTEVCWTRARPGEVTGYMATVPGLLKVVETFVACVIFVFISNTNSYERHGALKWCLAVYCIFFILSLAAILLCVGECTSWLPCSFHTFLSGYTLLAVLAYATATVLWPLYQFSSRYGGHSRPSYCPQNYGNPCLWDRLLAVAVLTAINLLAYLADLIHSARLIFVHV